MGAGSRGFDAGKKVNGRKRHVVVNTMGLLLAVIITSAAVQDRDAAHRELDRLRFTMPSVALIWADGGYAGELVSWVKRVLRVSVEIVRKPLGIKTFPGSAPPLGPQAHVRLDRHMPPPRPRPHLRDHSDATIKNGP